LDTEQTYTAARSLLLEVDVGNVLVLEFVLVEMRQLLLAAFIRPANLIAIFLGQGYLPHLHQCCQ
jgi:hypothetical protein